MNFVFLLRINEGVIFVNLHKKNTNLHEIKMSGFFLKKIKFKFQVIYYKKKSFQEFFFFHI